MKTRTKTLLAAVMLLAISCKKENTAIQSSVITDENSSQELSSDANELDAAHAVRIGSQVWKKKDLTTRHYRNGDRIPEVQDGNAWRALTTGAWCWYKNNPVAGKLYNWYAVNDPRGLAPEGWHVPSDAEWTILTTFLGGETVAGGKMKETGTAHWLAPNIDAINSSGFTGLPGGYRYYNGALDGIGYLGYWWSSTEGNSSYAWYRALLYDRGGVSRDDDIKRSGFSVRCLKD
jgi:uncharacterized protein (TIGR02145 family)